MSKFLADLDDIPSSFQTKSTASKLLDTIHESRKEEGTYEVSTVDEPEDTPVTELEEDFDLARKNIAALLKVSNAAINSFYDVATSSDSPLSIEILSSMIKDSIDMNKSLIDIHQQRERILSSKINNGSPTSTSNPTQNNITTQNNIMCSPGDLVKMIQEANGTAINVDTELLPLPKKDDDTVT